MSKKTRKQRDPPPALCGRDGGKSPTGKSLPFVRLYSSLLQAPEYTALTSTARLVYICMMLEAGMNMDKFTFPASVAERYGFKGHTLRDAIKDLENAGFIQCIECNRTKREKNVYSASSNWMFFPPEKRSRPLDKQTSRNP